MSTLDARLVALGGLFVVASTAGCGGGTRQAGSARARWAGDAAHPAPSSFGLAAVDAARAMWDAAARGVADPRWQCEDGTPDLRATSAATRGQVGPLGPAPQLAFAAVVVTLSSPARGYAPDDVVDLKGAPDARVVFQARALVAPDGHVGWMDTAPPDPERPAPWAYLSALEQPRDDRARLEALPGGLGRDLLALVASATSASCDVPVATVEDLDRLPYPVDRQTRDAFALRVASLRRRLPRLCATVASGTGPWEVHVSHVEAGLRDPSTSAAATLRARVHLQAGVPCLGAVEVPRTGRDEG